MKNTFLLMMLFTASVAQAQLSGPTSGFVGSSYNYTFGNGTVYPGGAFHVTGGTITSQSSSGSTYSATVQWTTYGTGSLIFQDASHVTRGSISVTVGVGTPVTTFSTNPVCGSTTITRIASPPTGVAWYWQTTSTGTSTSSSASTYSITSTSTMYLRAQWTASAVWSASSLSTNSVTVIAIPAAPATSTDGNVISSVSVAVPVSVSTVSGATYKWFTVASGGTVVAGSPTTNTYSPVLTSPSSQPYYVEAEIGACSSSSRKLVTAYVHPVPIISVTNGGIVDDGDPVTLSVSNYTYTTYSWILNGVTIAGANASSYSARNGGSYTVSVTKNNSAAVVSPTGGTVSNPYNYVISSDILIDNVTSEAAANSLSPGSRNVTTQYLDGLGRALQDVKRQNSPGGYDIVEPHIYDGFGREASKYLPFASTETSGRYKDQSTMFAAGGDYNNGFYHNSGGNVAVDTKPYTSTVYDDSPEKRPFNSFGVGLAWQSANKFVKSQYLTNVAGTAAGQDQVIFWTINGSGMPVVNTAVNSGIYPTGTLTINSTVDEDGNETRSYKDFSGNEILRMVHITGSSTDLSTSASAGNWTRTYYIYDDLNLLRFVLQPELSKKLVLNGAYVITSPDLNSLAFQYQYDGRQRLIQKQVPGSGISLMVYDDRDRVVLHQDANLAAINEWIFTKYDVLNRPIMTGQFDTTALSQAQMQTVVNNFYQRTASRWGEAAGTTVHGYTCKSYPLVTNESKYLTVTYYDNYNFNSNTTYAFLSGVLPAQTVNGFTYSPETSALANTTGLTTGTKVRVLDAHAYWLKTLNFYDSKRRLVQTISDHARTGTKRTTFLYDFANRKLSSRTTYNDNRIAWTNLVAAKEVGNELVCTSNNSFWGGNGAASVVTLPASTNGWVETTNVVSTTGLSLFGLSSQDLDASYTSINYGIYLPTTPSAYQIFENGTLLYNVPGTPVAGDVLRVERIGSTIYYKKNDVVVYTSSVASSGQLLVDVAMAGAGSMLNTRASFITTGIQTVDRTFQYDLTGRPLKTLHSLNGATPIVLTSLKYNEIAQVVEKNLYSTDNVNYQQSVDMRYNIRGWLSSINNSQLTNTNGNDDSNDLFGMNLVYNESPGNGNSPLYNGNISSVKWSKSLAMGAIKDQCYNYSYDGAGRLLGATYLRDSTSWTNPKGWFNESGYSYDLNGNIMALTRNDAIGRVMDGLSYTYTGNQLLAVADVTGNKSAGFIDGSNTGNDYAYDPNGNMITDQNKLLTASNAIQYNYLNLPSQVSNSTSQSLMYSYDALGIKLGTKTYTGGNLVKSDDYLDELFYENDTLRFVNHEEGRIVVNMKPPEYQYFLKDHLGNVRLSFTTVPPAAQSGTATWEDPTNEAVLFNTYETPSSMGTNHSGTHSAWLQGLAGQQIAIAKSYHMYAGEKVEMNGYALGWNSGCCFQQTNIWNFASVLLGAFGVAPPLAGETGTAGAALNSWGNTVVGAYAQPGGDHVDPFIFFNILVFDKNFNLLNVVYQQVSGDLAWHNYDLVYNSTEECYVYAYISHEDYWETMAWIDDVTITYTPSNVIQANDYYPFGLKFNSFNREHTVTNKLKLFQGQEHVDDLGLNWDSFKWRNHQPDIGRFFNIDPLADKYVYNSPYAFSENNVVSHKELEGLEKASIQGEATGKFPLNKTSNDSRTPAFGIKISDPPNGKSEGSVSKSGQVVTMSASTAIPGGSKAEMTVATNKDGSTSVVAKTDKGSESTKGSSITAKDAMKMITNIQKNTTTANQQVMGPVKVQTTSPEACLRALQMQSIRSENMKAMADQPLLPGSVQVFLK